MSVFKNIGKSISNKSREISQKAKIMSETSSLNNIIRGEECKIDSQYKLIGKMYFENYGNNPSEEFKPAVDAINSSMIKISETKEEIAKIKSRYCCPACGTPFKNDAVFCSKCGTRLPEINKSAAKPNLKTCSKCGNTLDERALFCNVCGTKLDEKNELASDASVKTENAENIPAFPVISGEGQEACANDAGVTESEKTESSVEESVNTLSEEKAETAEKIFCPECKNEVLPDDLFCDSCGAKLKATLNN